MTLNTFLIALVTTVSSGFATSFSFGESIEAKNERELIDLVMQNKEHCTEKVTSDRIYLLSKNLFPTTEGLFLRLDEWTLVRLPCIYSDENGCFVTQPYIIR